MMARMASTDIMCVGPKAVREKFSGIIRYATLILVGCVCGWKYLEHVRIAFFDVVKSCCKF